MMKQKLNFLLVLLFILLLSGCKEETTLPNFVLLQSEATTVRVGEELELSASSNIPGDLSYSVDDETIATVDENGYLTALEVGEVIVTVQSLVDPTCTSSLTIQVLEGVVTNVKAVGVHYGKVGDKLTFKYTLEPKEVESSYVVTSNNPDIASVNKDNSITLNKQGIADIVVTVQDSGAFTYHFNVGCFTYHDIYVSSDLNGKEDGETVQYNEVTYYYNYTCFSSINKAAKVIEEDATIIVDGGSYDEDYTIKYNDVTVKGINNPIFSGTTILINDVKNVTIEGFYYQNNAGILLYGGNNNILIQNNIFEDVHSNITWSDNINEGVIKFYPSKKYFDNITITNNSFFDCDIPAINISYMNNIKITNNSFTNCLTDCIRFSDQESSTSSQWLIKNNSFKKSYNAIYSSTLGSSILSYDTIISIFDNDFDDMSNYCICLDGYHQGTISMDVRYNDFTYNAKCIYLDTLDDTNKDCRFYPYIENNNIICTNTDYLFNTTGGDLVQAIFDFNYISNGKKTYSLEEVKKAVGSNVIISEINEFENVWDERNQIYGKSVVYLDQETSFICQNATRFYSSDPTVLTIDNNGKVTPLKEGTTQVMAYQEFAVCGTFDVTVKGNLQIDYASRLLQVAYEQEGYVEGDNNYTKYGVWYAEQVHDDAYIHGQWCAMFVSWCADQAGIPRVVIPLYAACVNGRSWFENKGLFQYKENYTPKAGDIIFFLSNGASHTGIVISCDGSTVYTIEGNTSNMCAKRSYAVNNARITGYGTPEYPAYTGKSTIVFDVSDATDGSGHSTK